MESLHCHSCHMKQSADNPVILYQVADKLLCPRCFQLHGIYVSTTPDILGTQPDRYVSALFRETAFLVPAQALANFSSYVEPVKRQILLASREQAAMEGGNAVIGTAMTISKLESLQYLLSFSGTVVYSSRWEDAMRQRPAPIPVPYAMPVSAQPQEEAEEETVVVVREREEEEDRPAAGKYPDVGGSGQMNRFKKLVSNQ